MAVATPTLQLQSASEAHATEVALAAAATIAARRQASRTPERVAQTIAAFQVVAAQEAAASVTAMLAEQGVSTAQAASVATSALAGYASTGAPLAAAASSATDVGLLAAGVIADTFRQSQLAAMATRRHVTGYVRMLNPPSCSRCVILAGKNYNTLDGIQFHQVGSDWVRERAHGEGFQRHPLCDCVMIPASEDVAGDLTTDPRVYFDSLGAAEQVATFGKAGAEAIRLGADIGKVVNARRGMSKAQVFGSKQWTTLAGTSRRGSFGRINAQREAAGQHRLPVRLMPESILALAGADRDHALRLLALYGYLV